MKPERGTSEAAAYLRRRGLRATVPRRLVYVALKETGGHHSVDDIVALLSRRGHDVSRMTVYNAVAAMTDAGMIMCADAGPGRALYEVNEVWHHHFVCRDCGVVVDVPCVTGSKPCLQPPGDPPGIVDEAQVIFRGRCHRCAGTAGGERSQPRKG